MIHPNWQLFSDYTPLTITIPITEENIITFKFSIAKNSNEEELFIKDIATALRNLNTSDLSDSNRLENVVNTLTVSIEHAWRKNAKQTNITRHSKTWWNENCN